MLQLLPPLSKYYQAGVLIVFEMCDGLSMDMRIFTLLGLVCGRTCTESLISLHTGAGEGVYVCVGGRGRGEGL